MEENKISDDNLFMCLTTDLIDETKLIKYLKADECGAEVIFLGSTRNHHQGRPVTHLEYEAFSEMAEKQLQSIGQQMKKKWPDLSKIVLVHRLGLVKIGEVSVFVGASSAHRSDSLRAVDYGIQHIKEHVAIWKKEYYGDGGADWKENVECAWTNNK